MVTSTLRKKLSGQVKKNKLWSNVHNVTRKEKQKKMSIEKQINTLKKVNEVHRIVNRNTSIYTRDLVGSLIEKIRMLQKQKKFLQTKLREACNGTKSNNN